MAEAILQRAAVSDRTGTAAAVVPPVAMLPQPMEGHPAWPMISRLPTTLAVSIPLRGLKVCNLLSLQCGQTVASEWAATQDVPLKVGMLQIGWGEFEVVQQRMALRLTRLA